MNSLDAVLVSTNWSGLDHAYGDASDAPRHLLALLGDDIGARSKSVTYLNVKILHQGAIYSATGPVAQAVAAMLTDHATLAPVEGVVPCGPEPQPLRIALLGFLADVAKACEFELDDAALLAEAHPAGRDEAELQRMKVMMRTALRELGPDASTRVLAERGPLLAALAEAAADETFQRAMHARHVLACRTHVPELFASVTELFDDPDQDIKSSALETAVYLSGHSALASVRPTLARRLEAEMPGVTDPSALAVTARLLGMLAASSKTLLSDEHP